MSEAETPHTQVHAHVRAQRTESESRSSSMRSEIAAPYVTKHPWPETVTGGRAPAEPHPVPPSGATAADVLRQATRHLGARAATYDQPGGERSAAAVATAFNAITRRTGDRAISESEAWLFLQILKQVRLFTAPGYHADSAEDNVSYAALLAESKAKEAMR